MELSYKMVECKMVKPTLDILLTVNTLTIHTSNHNPQYLSNRNENIYPHKDLSALLMIKNLKQSKCLPTSEWINCGTSTLWNTNQE